MATTTTNDQATRELHRFADEKRGELAANVRTLIHQARMDLHYGSYRVGENYPGFMEAMQTIRSAVDDLGVDDVWIDWDAGEVMETEPEGHEIANPYWSVHDPDGEPSSWIEPHWETITRFDRGEVIRAMLGDLADYL